MDDLPVIYREVIPDQTNQQIWKDISLNTGATQSTLQDIKVPEKAGGYYYRDSTKLHNRNRFIYWRTSHDVLELSEISLDLNLNNNNIRYKFADSPVLTVSIHENILDDDVGDEQTGETVIVLVATVCSLHRFIYTHPDKMNKNHNSNMSNDIYTNSIFHDATVMSARNPSTFYVIGHTNTSNHPIPHTAGCWLQSSGQEAIFSLAYQSTLMLFTMNCNNGQTHSMELKQHYIVPRIFSNITGAFRGKSNTSDGQYVTSVVFNAIAGQTFLYALYRDDHIRMWSIKTGQCVAVVNCLQDGKESRPQGPQTNSLRCASSSILCAFLCCSMGSEFVTIRTQCDGNTGYSMHRISLIQASKYDLVDFEINDQRIWALWCNSEGDFNISSYSLKPETSELNWICAALESPPDRYSVSSVEHGVDSRQAFCSFIFRPGKFQRDVIAKALMMFKRSNHLYDPNLSMAALKDRVCQAIETEIQNEIKDFDVTDDEYIDISAKLWERFYSCCEQYHIKATQPIGLVTLESVDGVCIIKKNAYSLLRPCETLEYLLLANDNIEFEDAHQLIGVAATMSGVNDIDDNPNKSNEFSIKSRHDVTQLIGVLAMLEHHLLDEIKTDINNKLYQLRIPNVIIAKLVTDMLSHEYGDNILTQKFLSEIHRKIKTISDLPAAMIILLNLLRLDQEESEAMQTHLNVVQNSRLLLSIGHLFCSDIGRSFVAESLSQIAAVRYALCRNLLILQYILIDTFDVQNNILEMIRSRCMPETVVFIQAYYVMVWICEASTYSTTSSVSLENSIQRLSLLPLSDSRYQYQKTTLHSISTLLELFLKCKGSHIGLSLLVNRSYRNVIDPQWQLSLLPLVHIIGQLIWAVSGNFTFGEWLLGSCQHILIQEYVRLLNSWCEWNNCSRHFIAAVSLLDNGETYKAYDLFMQAGKGVLTEPFLEKIILPNVSTIDANIKYTPNEAMTQYYLRVIQLFEQYLALDCIIELAKSAIGVLDKSDPQLAMFQSIIFTNHLNLEHYSEAYHALTENAEASRRKDCLRQLVVCLFEKKRLDLLMQFPYVRLQDELENIIESRARAMAIENNINYDFLYAFHITKENMRKAASIMYEKAMRYLLECDSVQAMQNRYESLLTCFTTLHLVDEKFAWIAKPIINDIDDNPMMVIDQSHTSIQSDSAEIDYQERLALKQEIIVLEKNDIMKELLLTEAVLCLSKHRKELNSILNADADELIAVLSNYGLYTAAIKLAKGFGKKISMILENLAVACIRTSLENTNDSWIWLQENDLSSLPHRNSAPEMTWKLLELLINENESGTELRKSVTNRILNMGEFLPHWLYISYKKSNPSELLNLLVRHGRLIEATSLAIEYIKAMISNGGEYFGLKNSIQPLLPALCFPVNIIDTLLYGLEINMNEDVEYKECFKELSDMVESYQKLAKDVSEQKIQYEVMKNVK